MAINYGIGQIPKGPSNSNSLSSTPGTQQTAAQNVGGLNLNPNMPAGPQVQKRARSDYQSSLMNQVQKPQAPAKPPGGMNRVVTQGMPMGQNRGYNIFSGMDAGQISNMNKTMGLSNMTALPSLLPQQQSGAGFGLKPPGRPMSMQLMAGVPNQDVTGETTAELQSKLGGVGNFLSQGVEKLSESTGDQGGFNLEGFVEETLADAQSQTMGVDPEKKAQAQAYLDDKYANLLQQALAGVNRQAAMMGAGIGSGAYSALMNGAMANVLSQMSDEYAAIELADMNRADQEYYQNLGVQMDLANMLAGLSDPQAGLFEKIEISNALSGQVFGGITDLINNLPSDTAYNAVSAPVNHVMDMFNEEMLNAESPAEQEQILAKYNKIANELFDWLNLYAQYSQEAINAINNDDPLSEGMYNARNAEIAAAAAKFFALIGQPELANEFALTI